MSMKRFVFAAVGGLLCGLAAACGSDQSASLAGDADSFVAEDFCRVEGLSAPLRHTFILIDSTVLAHTENAEQFVASNSWVRDAVLALADPDRAINSGASAPRERITIIRLPENGSAGSRVFTGCIPAMTPEEITQAGARNSRVGSFFTGGVREELEEKAAFFRTRLVAALQAAARAAEGRRRLSRGPIEQSSLFAALNGSAGLLEAGQSIPRLVLVTDLSRTRQQPAAGVADARRAGFVAGQQLGLNLRGSEIVLIQPNSGDAMRRAFLDAFFLAQQGQLIYAGEGGIGGLPLPARTVRRFVGQAAYPDGPEIVQIRIGIDRNGRLVGSWITLRDQHDRSVPLAGQAVCDGEELCMVRSTNDAFGQAWSLSPGGQPEFGNDMPFGGMRNVELRIDGDVLQGRVHDPLISQIGPNPTVNAIAISGNLRSNSTF
jgi:hypothetical protein